MKSEKEIRAEIEKVGMCENTYDAILSWVLKGEPRYSVKELEKIFDALVGGESYEWDTTYFIEFLKDPKKVKEILDD